MPVEDFHAVQIRAAAVWQRIVSLIGYFDLDPNRALDIILDVFSVNIATHWQFFLALLARSPWVGERTCLRNWEKKGSIEPDRTQDQYRGKTLDEILHLAEKNVKGAATPATANPQAKPKVLAQVLGFKFSHYQVGPFYTFSPFDETILNIHPFVLRSVPGDKGTMSPRFVPGGGASYS